MTIELESLGVLRVRIKEHLRMEGAAFGTRVVGTAESCVWEGGPVAASQVDPLANDWLTVDENGFGQVDARMVMRTDDGAIILIRYGGRLTYTSEGASVVTAPTFETNDDRYRWLNQVQAVAKGRRDGLDLVYEVYAVR